MSSSAKIVLIVLANVKSSSLPTLEKKIKHPASEHGHNNVAGNHLFLTYLFFSPCNTLHQEFSLPLPSLFHFPLPPVGYDLCIKVLMYVGTTHLNVTTPAILSST